MQTVPLQPSPLAVVPELPAPTNAAPVEAVVPPPRPPPPPPPHTPPTPPIKKNNTPWVPYESWYAFNGLTPPELLKRNGQPYFQLRTTNGVLALSQGSRMAYWNGLGFWLGYAPQILQGRLCLHILDVQKSLFPLLNRSPRLGKSDAVIVLDPGHGGRTPGTKSILENRYEKEFTLDWALRIQRTMVAKGWRVYLTRTNDVDVSLPDRIGLAEQLHADVFVSLHFNSAFPALEPSGLETYCLTPAGMPSSVTRDFDDDPKLAFPNNAFDGQNLACALDLQQALLPVTGGDRTVRRARFLGVLRGQNRPAVLIEGGYLSNPQEARRIADPSYRQELGEAVARALARHFGQSSPRLQVVKPANPQAGSQSTRDAHPNLATAQRTEGRPPDPSHAKPEN